MKRMKLWACPTIFNHPGLFPETEWRMIGNVDGLKEARKIARDWMMRMGHRSCLFRMIEGTMLRHEYYSAVALTDDEGVTWEHALDQVEVGEE